MKTLLILPLVLMITACGKGSNSESQKNSPTIQRERVEHDYKLVRSEERLLLDATYHDHDVSVVQKVNIEEQGNRLYVSSVLDFPKLQKYGMVSLRVELPQQYKSKLGSFIYTEISDPVFGTHVLGTLSTSVEILGNRVFQNLGVIGFDWHESLVTSTGANLILNMVDEQEKTILTLTVPLRFQK